MNKIIRDTIIKTMFDVLVKHNKMAAIMSMTPEVAEEMADNIVKNLNLDKLNNLYSAVEEWFVGRHQVFDLDKDAKEQINKMLVWEQRVALDPKVSKDAVKLANDARNQAK